MISTGYFPYAQYVRDYNPPPPVINPNSGNQLDPTQPDPRVSSTSPMYSTISNTTMPNRQSSLLNVTDPRYSATYGNPLLRQVCIKIFYSGKGKIQLYFDIFCSVPIQLQEVCNIQHLCRALLLPRNYRYRIM